MESWGAVDLGQQGAGGAAEITARLWRKIDMLLTQRMAGQGGWFSVSPVLGAMGNTCRFLSDLWLHRDVSLWSNRSWEMQCTDLRTGWVRGCGDGHYDFSGFLALELPLSVLAVGLPIPGALGPLWGQAGDGMPLELCLLVLIYSALTLNPVKQVDKKNHLLEPSLRSDGQCSFHTQRRNRCGPLSS